MSKLSIPPGTGPGPAALGWVVQILRGRPRIVPGRRPQRFRVRIIGANGEPIFWGEAYTNRGDAIEIARVAFPGCRIDDLTGVTR